MHEYLRHKKERVSGEGKGQTAEVATATRAWPLVCRRRSVVLSQNVERYHSVCFQSFFLLP